MLVWTTIAVIKFSIRDRIFTDVLWWLAVIWFACLGGCLGSFLTVVWDRLGTGEGFVLPRSRCPECDHAIRWYHNIPILGWILLSGRCYDCGSRIPIKHPLIEAVFALAFVFIGLSLFRTLGIYKYPAQRPAVRAAPEQPITAKPQRTRIDVEAQR